jgi:hypothetical protein
MILPIILQGFSSAVLAPLLNDAILCRIRQRPCRQIPTLFLVLGGSGIPDSFSLRSLPAGCSNL